jgi:hypothetical protein
VPAHLILRGDRVTVSITSRAESYTSVVGFLPEKLGN